MQIIPVLVISFIVLASIVIIAVALNISSQRKKNKNPNAVKDRDTIIKEANHRLSVNPKDPVALKSLADLYYNEGEFTKAMRTYQLLLDQSVLPQDMDETELNLRYGLSAMHCEAWSEAYKGLMIAKTKKPDSFEINANLGKLEFMRKNYDKTIVYLKKVLSSQPDHPDSLKYMGLSYYRMKRYSEAAPYLRQAFSQLSDDREVLFALAKCMYEISQIDTAYKLFKHLRTDPKYGPSAALYSGIIQVKRKNWEEAIIDFQIGLRHENISNDILIELKYRLAEAFTQTQQLDRALVVLNEIYDISPGYKDVATQIKRYQELNTNKNLQIYLFSPTNEFISLCRKIITIIFPKAIIKINETQVEKNEYVDLLAEVKTRKWEDVVLFRFMRSEGQVGELFIRDLYAHSKELYAGRGFCITAGSFSEEALRFVNARLIDLIDKQQLLKMLKTIDPVSISGPA